VQAHAHREHELEDGEDGTRDDGDEHHREPSNRRARGELRVCE
jgi:hypothetical protein